MESACTAEDGPGLRSRLACQGALMKDAYLACEAVQGTSSAYTAFWQRPVPSAPQKRQPLVWRWPSTGGQALDCCMEGPVPCSRTA